MKIKKIQVAKLVITLCIAYPAAALVNLHYHNLPAWVYFLLGLAVWAIVEVLFRFLE